MDGGRNYLIAIVAAMALEAGIVLLAVQFVNAVWLRVVLMAVVPVAFLLAAIFSDRE